MFRHGDLLIVPVDQIDRRNRRNDKILAEGEVTGHHHMISGNAIVYGNRKDAVQYLEIVDPSADITHEEHNTISLSKGNYNVIKQREYDPIAEIQATLNNQRETERRGTFHRNISD